MVPLDTVVKANFITASAAARHMLRQGSGVIIFLTGSPAQPHTPASASIGAAFGAIENLTRHMAIDLSPSGVRVVCVRTSANPDSRTIHDLAGAMAQTLNISSDDVKAGLAQNTLLKVSPRTTDTAFAAALVASDLAAMMTGTVLNASAGVVPD
jgi:NAD(P)-dependent dehydrogenase (short-subunit alcohol dehydrogenase family)